MGLRESFLTGLSQQLGRPNGLRGMVTARGLNRGNRAVVLAAVTKTGLEEGQVGADIGFGGGVGLGPLLARVGPGGHIHGIEISETMLTMARRGFREDVAHGRLSLHAGDMLDLPLPDDLLDAAITVNTIYFVEDPGRALSEMARVLRPGGTLVLGVGDPSAMAAMPFTKHGFTLRPIDDLKALLRNAGFAEPQHERVGDSDRAFHLLVARQALAG